MAISARPVVIFREAVVVAGLPPIRYPVVRAQARAFAPTREVLRARWTLAAPATPCPTFNYSIAHIYRNILHFVHPTPYPPASLPSLTKIDGGDDDQSAVLAEGLGEFLVLLELCTVHRGLGAFKGVDEVQLGDLADI